VARLELDALAHAAVHVAQRVDVGLVGQVSAPLADVVGAAGQQVVGGRLHHDLLVVTEALGGPGTLWVTHASCQRWVIAIK